MYQILKPILFTQDPEQIHNQVMQALEFVSKQKILLSALRQIVGITGNLETECFGLKFPNPVGLAAGLDKNALALPAWPALGFGFVEIGSVTAHAQPGNDKPRLFRLPQDNAIINRMGFNNHGAEIVAQRLAAWQSTHGALGVPLGINLGKSKITPLENAPQDYLESLKHLWQRGDYFVVNVSSPNTPGLRELQDKDKLQELLSAITNFATQQKTQKPILLKIAPDLTNTQLDEIVSLVETYKLAGMIATNTTISREGITTQINETGGMSGAPLRARSLEVLKHLRAQLNKNISIVSVGGISSTQDVLLRLEAGAKLVQIYTGFIYEGPFLARNIVRELVSKNPPPSASLPPPHAFGTGR